MPDALNPRLADRTASTAASILPLPDGKGPGSAEWWDTQLKWSAEIRKDLLEQPKTGWRDAAKAYCGKLKPTRPDGIRVNVEFEKTEQKRYQLFFRLPTLKLRALPRTIRDSSAPQKDFRGQPLLGPDGQPLPTRDLRKAIAIFREVLTRLAGPKGANTKAAMTEVLFDVLCPAGISFTKVGYERYEDGQVPMQVGTQPDPAFQQPGAILNISVPPPEVPVYTLAPNVISEKYYVSRISPANALVPAEFRLSDYEQADWLGHDFAILVDVAKAKGWISGNVSGDASSTAAIDDDRIVPMEKKGQRSNQVRCREVFYYAQRVDAAVKHPDKIRRLVFVAGTKDPVVHEDFQDQRFDGRGRFVGGLRTLPIKVLALRYVSDTAYPPSDCQITRETVDELAEFRTLQMIHRRKAGPLRWVDIHGLIDETVKDAIKRGEYYDTIPTDGPGDKLVGEVAQAQYPTENRVSEDRIMGDINRAWALGSNASAVQEEASPSATEIASIAQATANRLGGERETVTQFWCRIVEALGSLVQLYADHEDYVEILGEDGARTVEAWTKETIQGEFLYEAVPNSAMAPDAAADRDLALNRYNLLANDPFANREQLYRDTVEAYDGDPDRLTLIPQPPKPPIEPPRASVNIKAETDLNPAAPQYANVVALLTALGVPPNTESAPMPAAQPNPITKAAPVVDRERMRMAAADNADQRAGGLVGMGVGGR